MDRQRVTICLSPSPSVSVYFFSPSLPTCLAICWFVCLPVCLSLNVSPCLCHKNLSPFSISANPMAFHTHRQTECNLCNCNCVMFYILVDVGSFIGGRLGFNHKNLYSSSRMLRQNKLERLSQ